MSEGRPPEGKTKTVLAALSARAMTNADLRPVLNERAGYVARTMSKITRRGLVKSTRGNVAVYTITEAGRELIRPVLAEERI